MVAETLDRLNSKHLSKGSLAPNIVDNGKIRLYSMRFCPYAERIMIALLLKKIPSEVVNIALNDKPEWYFQINPLGKVPSIDHGGKVIYESLVIAEYLDQVFSSGKKLLPDDPFERAKEKISVEQLSQSGSGLLQWTRNRQDPAAIENVKKAFDDYEALLKDGYFSGKTPGFADYMHWPWIERLGVIEVLSQGELSVTSEKHPKLAAYISNMKAIPEISAVALDGHSLAKFVESRQAGKPNYDGIL